MEIVNFEPPKYDQENYEIISKANGIDLRVFNSSAFPDIEDEYVALGLNKGTCIFIGLAAP